MMNINNEFVLVNNNIYKSNYAYMSDAIRSGKLEVIKKCFDKGVDINIRDELGFTLMHEAARLGQIWIIGYLFDNGGDIIMNSQTEDGVSPMQSAAYHGRVRSVQYLIDKGANMHIQDEDGWTPLYIAAMTGHDNVVKCLIDNGVNVNIRSFDKNLTALGTAIETSLSSHLAGEHLIEYKNIIKLLISLSNMNIKEIDMLTNLFEKCPDWRNEILPLMKRREVKRYFMFCALFTIGTDPVEEKNNKQEKNSQMIGYDPPNNKEEIRPFPPMFNSNFGDSLFDAILAAEIWKYARDVIKSK